MGVFFKDIIGQKEVVQQLRRCVEENRLAHALLITGPQRLLCLHKSNFADFTPRPIFMFF